MRVRRFARSPGFLPRAAVVLATVSWTAAFAPPAARGEQAATSVYARGAGGGVPADGPAESPGAQAERILAGALVAVDRLPSVQIRFRQKTRIGSKVLVGSGLYVQSGSGDEQRYRLESLLNADTETFETVEVSDGVTAWFYRRLGASPPRLERTDVRRVRERLAEFGPPGEQSISPHLGGLQRSMWLMRQWFRFQTATAAEVEGQQVWLIDGRWHQDSLALIVPALREATRRAEGVLPAEMPDGMPWSIRFTITRSDLLPRRIEYLAIPGPRPVDPRPPEPIAVLDFFEIRPGEPVDASAFIYRPAPQIGMSDVTESYVAGMGPTRP